MANILKHRKSRAWLITTAAVGVVLGAVNIVALGPLNNLIGTVLGPNTPITESGAKAYVNDYQTKEGALNHAKEMTLATAREGDILLKNENNALPIKTPVSDSSIATKPKISVFGKSSVRLQYGGSGSGGADFSKADDLYSSLEKAGFECNPTLKAFYDDDSKSTGGRPGNPTDLDSGKVITLAVGETPMDKYTASVKGSYQSDYKDAAIVVFTRIGGEGFDLPRTMTDSNGKVVDGAHDKDDHYLQLDQNETDLLKEVCNAGFKHVIVLLNSSNPMELGFLDDTNHYAYHKEIDGCLWIGGPGSTGANAIGEILSGQVNPSGRLTDTYSRDFKKDPTWNNFSDNLMENGDRYFYMDGSNRRYQNYYFVDYEEGIYVGYRYYETRYTTESDKESWYKNNVVYPFGYGLSYTQFEWEVMESSVPSSFKADEKMQVKVKVRNTGNVPGKDVIEVYAHAPYSSGGIEKADEVLVGFEKTDLLKPNEQKEYTIEVDPYDFASYDYMDKNNNGFKGYELEAGEYEIRVSRSAHDHVKTLKTSLGSDVRFENDPVTGKKVENLYDDADDQLSTVLSRQNFDGTWPDKPSDEERCFSGKTDAKLRALRSTASNNPLSDDATPAPELAKMGTTTKTVKETVDGKETERGLILKDLQGKDYDDPLWEDLLNQITFDEMVYMYDNGAFRTQEIKSIQKPLTYDSDGPVGWNNFMDANHSLFYDTNGYTSEIVIASTWNRELAKEVGEAMGNEGIAGVEKSSKLPYTSLYAPGVNIHRSQFGGRNFEYMSEDGFLTGMMASAEIEGMQNKGLIPTVKHFALNEQETHRSLNGDISWVTEQAMREIFLKPFEKAVKVGNVRAVMSSFNRIGLTWTGGDYRLLTTILREEWGFQGYVICDFNTCAHMDTRQMAYAGGDLNLATTPITWAKDSSNAKDVYILRKATKNILYSVANSNAMGNKIIGYIPSWWEFLIWGLDALYVAGFGVWGFFAIKSVLKSEKKEEVSGD